MSGRSRLWLARTIGAAVGMLAVAALVVANRPQVVPARLGASVVVDAAPAGAIRPRVAGGGPLLAAASLRPGGPALRGRLILHNRAGRSLRVYLRPLITESAGADAIWRAVRLESDRPGLLAPGSVADQVGGRAEGLRIPARGRRAAELSLSLRPDDAAARLAPGEHLRLTLSPVREVAR